MGLERFGQSDEAWRLTLQHSPMGMALVSPSGQMLAVNESWAEMLGYPEETLVEMTFQEFTHPDDLALDLSYVADCLAGTIDSYRIEKRYVRGDGSLCWVDLSVALLRDDDGEPKYFISQIVDVTRERAAQAELALAQAQLAKQMQLAEAIFNAVDVGLALVDVDGRMERWNARHDEFLRIAHPDGFVDARSPGAIFDGEGQIVPIEALPAVRAICGEEFDDLRVWIGAVPETRRVLSVSARSVHDDAGRLTSAALAYKDVTELVRALAVQDEFVASVSHELRTPLTMVLGHLELLRETSDLTTRTLDSVQVAERNAHRLARLVTDLLDVSYASGKQLQVRDADVVVLVREAVGDADPAARHKDLTLELEAPASMTAAIDRHRLRQAVDNLISNAIKYTEAGGAIRVRLTTADDWLTIEVEDSGIGIPDDEAEQLFSRFYRGELARERQIPGTGLGLNIVQGIAEAHGGSVSHRPGESGGSVFTITVPVRRLRPVRVTEESA